MIVPMKKVILVSQTKDAKDTVKALRRMGLVHIEHICPPQGKDIIALSEDILLINQAINTLASAFPRAKQDTYSGEEIDYKRIATHIIDIKKRQEQLKEYAVSLRDNIDKWRSWGDFDPQQLARLAQKNIQAKFYQIPERQIKELKGNFFLKRVSHQGDLVNCLVITQDEISLPYLELKPPKMSLSQMRQRLVEDKLTCEKLDSQMEQYVVYYQELLQAKAALEKELEFQQALAGMGQAASLTYIKGFIPFDAQDTLLAQAAKAKWALSISDPSLDENVPTLLRNPRWVSLISPLFKFLEILPGYSELDISLPFLIFFSLFFGILIADAGYGLSYAFIAFFIQRKIGKKLTSQSVFHLFYLLSSSSIIFGLLTGTFFGQEWLLKLGIKPLMPALNNPHHIQALCFFIGAVHLSIGRAWRAILKFPTQTFLADLGWVAMLWVSYFLSRTLILGEPFIRLGLPLDLGGIFLVLFFSEPRRNIFRRAGAGFTSVTFGLSFVSVFTDIVSYIRLFAVGLAGVAIADAFNAMAALVGFKTIIAIIVSVSIIIIGHGLGIVLGPVSVLVHGVRLNVLEFSGHTNVTWSGVSYKPFKEE
jgi:V/A-type H+-transporting ATPase subunit I